MMMSVLSGIRRHSLLLALLGLTVAGGLTVGGPVQSQPLSAGSPRAMVAAANPLAVKAGLEVLRKGGSAVDAAVAVQAVLGLVEPQSSGLGGGAFMTYLNAATGKVIVYDGRETAPQDSLPDQFLDAAGDPVPFGMAVTGGSSVGVPGAVAMLGMAQQAHGKAAWADLFGDAIRLADDGFIVSPRLALLASADVPQAKSADATAYFTKADGQLIKAGDRLVNAAYAQTLRVIADKGPRALLEGDLATRIVARAGLSPAGSGMTLKDLADYQPTERAALCQAYRIEYYVCVPPPPSSGVSLLQALKILESTDIANRFETEPRAWLLLAEAERLMYADRDQYVGDPAFVDVPVKGLLDPAYVRQRASLIGSKAGPPPRAGEPPLAKTAGLDATMEPAGTSHFVVVDRAGNVVSMTTTVESLFGSGRMVGGFFLNNQLTDFSFQPVDAGGKAMANAVAGGKRPRSSMSPVVVLDSRGKFVAALGSPGGSSILSYNLKTLVGILDWKMDMKTAIALPNLVARGSTFTAEPDKMGPKLVKGLEALGVTLTPFRGEASGLHGVMINKYGVLEGAADPRREGTAEGL